MEGVTQRPGVIHLVEHAITPLPVTPGQHLFLWEDLLTVVIGRLITNRVEVEGNAKGKDTKPKPKDGSRISSDEAVMDLYLKSSENVWRI